MNASNQNKVYATLTSFLGLSIFAVLFIIGIIFFSYLLIIGGIIGVILFAIGYLRAKFLRRKSPYSTNGQQQIHHGRTIDQEE